MSGNDEKLKAAAPTEAKYVPDASDADPTAETDGKTPRNVIPPTPNPSSGVPPTKTDGSIQIDVNAVPVDHQNDGSADFTTFSPPPASQIPQNIAAADPPNVVPSAASTLSSAHTTGGSAGGAGTANTLPAVPTGAAMVTIPRPKASPLRAKPNSHQDAAATGPPPCFCSVFSLCFYCFSRRYYSRGDECSPPRWDGACLH